MAASAPQSPAGDDRNLVTIDENYLAPTFEDRLAIFWEKHARTVVAVIVIVVAALVARWLFGFFAERREMAIRAEYAEASTPEQLQAFAAAHPQAPLSGAAHLRLADQAYEAGNFSAARDAYQAASALLAGQPLGARARLGAAIAPLQSGDTAAGKTALEALANDTAFATTLRAEAAYHLAVLARDSGDTAEATRWTTLVLSVDPEGIWSQRAMQLRSALPPAPEVSVSGSATGSPDAEGASAGAASPAPAAEEAAVSFPAVK